MELNQYIESVAPFALFYLVLFSLFLCLLLISVYHLFVFNLKKKLLFVCGSPLMDPETLSALITLSKQSICYGTVLGSLYNRRLITPIGTVKGYDVFITFGGIGISKSYFNILNVNLTAYFDGDGNHGVGFCFTYGATPKVDTKITEESFLYSFVEALKRERIEVSKRVQILENVLLKDGITEEERAASFISKEVYLRRLVDNEETLSLLNSYLEKMKKGPLILEMALPSNLGYSPTGGLGVSYNDHFVNVCLENKALYDGPFRRFWQQKDCPHFHKKGDIGCLTELRAKKFELSLETLNENSAIIPYSYNLIKLVEEFGKEVGFKPPKLTTVTKSVCEDPVGYIKSGKRLFMTDTKGELSTIWQDLMKEKSIFYDICIQDSLSPEYPLDLRGGLTLRALGLFFLFSIGYLDNSSSIYFDGLCYRPVEVARDLYNIREYSSFVEFLPYNEVICLKREFKYKIIL